MVAEPPCPPLRWPGDQIVEPEAAGSGQIVEVAGDLEALSDALQARKGNTKATESTEAMIDQLNQLVTDLTTTGGDVDRNDYGTGDEWKTDLRYLLAVGTDSRYKDQ